MEKLINDFSYGLFFWQALILLVVIFVLGKFAWKPIVAALEAREQGIQDALDSAEKARKDMLNLKVDNERLLNEARAERDAMINQAKVVIESEKNAAMAEIKSHVSTLSLEIAEKVLREELSNKDSQEKLVENMLADIKLN